MHHTFDKLLFDDGQTQINCPPVPNDDDSPASEHATKLLLRTLSEKESTTGIIAKREIKVYDCGIDITNTGSSNNNHQNHHENTYHRLSFSRKSEKDRPENCIFWKRPSFSNRSRCIAKASPLRPGNHQTMSLATGSSKS